MKKKSKLKKFKFIPVSKPLILREDVKSVQSTLRKGWISSEGPEVKKFEENFSKLINRRFSISVSNGTAALEIAIKALGIKKGDEVIVIAGKDKGKTGKIVRVISEKRKVIVSDINKYKKHQKPGNNEPGGIIEKDMPLDISNIAFFDAETKKGTRIGFMFNKDGKKIRINKKSGKEI